MFVMLNEGTESEETLLTFTLSTIGTAVALFFFFSPIVSVYQMIKKQIKIEEVSYLMFILSLLNALLWIVYGDQDKHVMVVVCNAIGGFVNLVYLCIYFFYYFSNKTFAAIYSVVACAISAGIIIVYRNVIGSKDVTGYSACIFNVGMYAAPAQLIIELFRTKNYKLIPIVTTVIGLLNAIIWSLFGIFKGWDFFVIIPNAIGIVFTIFQASLWFYFYKQSKETPTLQTYVDDDYRENNIKVNYEKI